MGLRDHLPSVRNKSSGIGTVGKASEKKVAKSLGARLRPASGAMASAKGDMTVDSFLLEAKSTVSESLGIKYEWLGKISNEAMAINKKPALAVTFTWPDGRAVPYGEWVMIPLNVFNEMLGGKEDEPL